MAAVNPLVTGMVLTNAERQARHKQRLKDAAMLDPYELAVLKEQIAMLERVVNELLAAAGRAQIQLPKAAKR